MRPTMILTFTAKLGSGESIRGEMRTCEGEATVFVRGVEVATGKIHDGTDGTPLILWDDEFVDHPDDLAALDAAEATFRAVAARMAEYEAETA